MIFEKFYHGKHAANLTSTGTGLGLAIVKQIVEAHGGEVRVTSQPNSGSTFIVILPSESPPKA
jgi:signal transduction histidine kinase